MAATLKEYLEIRLLKQQKWMSTKSREHKRKYYLFNVVVLIISSTIPVITAINDFPSKNLIIAIFGASVAILTALNSLFNFKQNWLRYRSASEILKSIYFKNLLTYDKVDKKLEDMIISKTESVLLEINTDWESTLKSSEDE